MRTSRPSTVATALGTRRGSPSGARSTSQTPCFIIGDHALGDGEGDRGLADTAGPDDCQQALARQSRDERRHRFLAADHPRHRERQIVRPLPARSSRAAACGGCLEADRGDEIVAPTGNGGDVAMAALAVAQGAAQGADLDLQVASSTKIFGQALAISSSLPTTSTGAFDKNGQDVQGAAAEAHRLIAFEQQPLARQAGGTSQTRSRVRP